MKKFYLLFLSLAVFLPASISFSIGKKADLKQKPISASELKVVEVLEVTNLPSDKPPEVVWAMDGQKFAYVERGGGEDKLRVSVRREKEKKLICSSRWIRDPTWSPDGTKIMFRRHGYEIAIYNIEKDSVEAAIPGRWARWSPDGTQIVYCEPKQKREKNYRIVISEPDGSQVRYLTKGAHPIWSSKGDKIALARVVQDIPSPRWIQTSWVINSDGTEESRLPYPAGSLWSPLGNQVCYNTSNGIVIASTDKLDKIEITPDVKGNSGEISWSPNGSKIAFSQFEYFIGVTPSGNIVTEGDGLIQDIDIWVVNSDGSALSRLTNTPDTEEDDPVWITPREIAVTVTDPEGGFRLSILKLNAE